MDLMLREEFQELIRQRRDLSVSIYLPTHRAGTEVQQDRIRLKNLLGRAEEELLERDVSRTDVEVILKPAVDLLQDRIFWNQQSEGLALFLAHDWFRNYRLPETFEEFIVISERFHIKPLIPLISKEVRFFLLSLSLDQVRLYHGDRFHFEEISTEAFPESMQEALRFDDPERELQFHTQTESPVTSAGRSAAFHGHGVSSEEKRKERIEQFLQAVEQGVYKLINDQTAPLILAGVDYLLPIYQEKNKYAHLLEQGILGNPENKSLEELHGDVKKILEPLTQKHKEHLASQYHALRERNEASDSLISVVPAAFQGRVRVLFVAKDREVWGNFNAETQKVTIVEKPDIESEDLLDLALVLTFLHGGEVYVVPEAKIPGDGVVSAIFRY
jgi:hypothetical protein